MRPTKSTSCCRATGVAGALMYSRYNGLVRWAMRRIARPTLGDTDPKRDYVYTDWDALDRFVVEFLGELEARRGVTAQVS